MNAKNTTNTAPTVATTMRQASAIFGVPLSVIKLAKLDGCTAFRGSRIHRAPLMAWIEANRPKVKKAEAEAAQREDIKRLKTQKLRIEVERLEAQVERERDAFVHPPIGAQELRRAFRIVIEEVQAGVGPELADVCRRRISARLPEINESPD